MPIITYTSQKSLPGAADALPSVRQTAAPTAANLAADLPKDPFAPAMAQVGADLQAIGNDMAVRENADMVNRADINFQTQLSQLQRDVKQRYGTNAWGSYEQSQKSIDEMIQKNAEGLNDVQKKAFINNAAKQRLYALDNIRGHEDGQRRTSLIDSSTQMIGANIEFAASNANQWQPPMTTLKTPDGAKAPGMTAEGNIDLNRRVPVTNQDGTVSTVRGISFTEKDGSVVLIPTVVGGKVVSDEEAIKAYDVTGANLGKFKTVADANTYAEALHKQQEAAYALGVPRDPTLEAKNNVIAQTNTLAQLNGWTKPRYDAELSKNMGMLHSTVLQTMMDSSPAQAQAYFEANKAEIPDALRAKMGDGIRKVVERNDVQAYADKWQASGQPIEAAIADIRKNFSGVQEDDRVKEVKLRYSEQNSLREAAQKAAGDEAMQYVARGQQIPGSLLSKMDGTQILSIKRMQQADADRAEARNDRIQARQDRIQARQDRAEAQAEARAERQGRDQREMDQRAAVMELTELSVKNPDAFAKVDLLGYGAKGLTTAQYTHFLALQNAPDVKQKAFNASVVTNTNLAATGLKLDRQGKADFMTALQKQAQEWSENNGGKLPDDKVMSGLRDQLSTPGTVGGFMNLWRTDTVAFKAAKAGDTSFQPKSTNTVSATIKQATQKSGNIPVANTPAELDALQLKSGATVMYNGRLIRKD